MNIASIDVGSNSVLLLIAEVNTVSKNVIQSKTYYSTPRISEGISTSGEISKHKITSLFQVLSEYERIIKSEHANQIIMTATKAFRAANNAAIISNEIEKNYGWKINIISGEQEARLTFVGTTFPFTEKEKAKIVIDIGGGSTEIVIGTSKKFSFKNSFSIGVVSLTEKYISNSLPNENEIALIKERIAFEFASLKNITPDYDKAYAVAGTPTTLACIKLGIRNFDEDRIDGFILSLEDIRQIEKQLAIQIPTEILEHYGPIVSGREDVLLSGVLILEGAMESLGLNKITVSTKGIRYGALYNALGWI